MVPVAWASSVISGEVAGKALMALVIVVAVVGAYRLAAGANLAGRLGAGLLYGAGPLMVTRVSVGHLSVALAAAILPWALPTLMRPDRDLRRTFLWCVALSLAGMVGGLYAGVVVIIGLAACRFRRWPITLALVVLAQLVWLTSGLVLAGSGVDPAPSDALATRIEGVFGLSRLVIGQGFWQRGLEIGAGSSLLAPMGLAVALLAVVGRHAVEQSWGRRAFAIAAVGLAIPIVSAVPGLRDLVADLTTTPIGATLRDGHRMLPLALIWFAVAAAHGGTALSRVRAGGAALGSALLGIALICLGPGLWGAGGQLDPVAIPREWSDARREVWDAPGPVLALPWSQYLNLPVAGGRRTHHPMPLFLGGDVLVSSDPRLGLPATERADPREPSAGRIAERARAGENVAEELVGLGVRWVALLHASNWTDYDGMLNDPDLETVVSGPTLDLLRVEDWQGPLATANGESTELEAILSPLFNAPGPDAGTWARPGGRGWLLGWKSVGTTGNGLASVPEGAGILWYWPSVLVIMSYIAWTAAIVVAVGGPAFSPSEPTGKDVRRQGEVQVRQKPPM